MKTYTVLIEIVHANINRLSSVPVYINFDRSKPPVGTATFTNKPDGLYANIRIPGDEKKVRGLYPCIGITGIEKLNPSTTGYINVIGLCVNRNEDPTIKPLL